MSVSSTTSLDQAMHDAVLTEVDSPETTNKRATKGINATRTTAKFAALPRQQDFGHSTLCATVNVSAAANKSASSHQNSVEETTSAVSGPSEGPSDEVVDTDRNTKSALNSFETSSSTADVARRPQEEDTVEQDRQVLPNNNSEGDMSVDTPMRSSNDTMELKKQRKSVKKPPREGQSSGRWTEEEHQAFLRGLHTYGREWKKVASHIETRTSAQVRSHAQKYFSKLQREEDSWATGTIGSAGEVGTFGANVASLASPGGFSASIAGSESSAPISSSVQSNISRILANPETVETEVEDTLQQLRARYEQLQRRLEDTASSPSTASTARKRRMVHDDESSNSFSLQNEELIALSVLRGSLPRGDTGSAGGSELSEENMEVESLHTESTDEVAKKAKHG